MVKTIEKRGVGLKSIGKSIALLTVFMVSMSTVGFSQSSTLHATDAQVLPYNVDEMVNTIQQAIEQPVVENEYAQMVLSEPGFPSVTVGEVINKKKLQKIEDWVSANPGSIEKLLIARKENYDKFFNPETKGQ